MRQAFTMDTVGSRIRYVRKLLGDTQEQFATRLSEAGDEPLTRGAVGNWERDQGIKRENVNLIGRTAHVSVDWLSNGRGELPTSATVNVPIKRPPIVSSYDPDQPESGPEGGVSSLAPYQGTLPNAIPDLEASGGAGAGEQSRGVQTNKGGVTYSADAVRGEIVLPQYLLGEYTRTAAARVHSIRVKGDSMETTLSPGDRVFADTNDTAIGQGGVFVILDHRFDEVLVKRIKRIEGGKRLLIRSDNPKQGDDEPVNADEITVIGRAVARLTRI